MLSSIPYQKEFAFYEGLFSGYEQFREKSVIQKRIKLADIEPYLRDLQEDKRFQVKPIAHSVENRNIYLVKIGTGKTRILLWSQMHGDESTATMAMLDIFNFFRQKGPIEAEKENILSKLSLYFIPMLNPDGAEKYQRRNALEIDLNRDALRLQSPETRVLKFIRDSIQADFGFNLHDQKIYYTAGKTSNPATISFLAPAYDHEKSINEVRGNAMKIIVVINDLLQKYIPGSVAKYNDDFEPRAFGDNMQKWGTSTILIESGGAKNDPEKQGIRKMNYMAILAGIRAIATKSYENVDRQRYEEIPENEEYLYDLVIRNVKIQRNGKEFIEDIGIKRYEKSIPGSKDYYYESIIEEIGDMSVFYGYDELDAQDMEAVPGETFPEVIESMEVAKKMDFDALLKSGYTSLMVRNVGQKEVFSPLLLNVVQVETTKPDESKPDESKRVEGFKLDRFADLILKQNGKVKYAVINGFVHNLDTGESDLINARLE